MHDNILGYVIVFLSMFVQIVYGVPEKVEPNIKEDLASFAGTSAASAGFWLLERRYHDAANLSKVLAESRMEAVGRIRAPVDLPLGKTLGSNAGNITAQIQEAQVISAAQAFNEGIVDADIASNAAQQAVSKATLLRNLEQFGGSLLEVVTDIAYEVTDNRNYQSFINRSGIPVTVEVVYHTALCPHADTFPLAPHPDHKVILYPGICQPKTISIYDQEKKKLLYSVSLRVGQSGGRHAKWVITTGPQEDQIVVRRQSEWDDVEYSQWVTNALPTTLKVVLQYRSALCPHDDVLIVQPGGSAAGNPKACLLKKITVFDNDTGIEFAQYDVPLGAFSERHGNWLIDKNEGRIVIKVDTLYVNKVDAEATITDVGRKIGIVGGSIGTIVGALGLAGAGSSAGLLSIGLPGYIIANSTAAAVISATGVGAMILMTTGALLGIGVGIYYAVEKDKNYQAFVNLLDEMLIIEIEYHTSACPHNDRFVLTPGDHCILYPKACQPKKIMVYRYRTNEKIAERDMIVGESGGRHGNWQLIRGSESNSVVIKERDLKSRMEYYQWFENTLNDTIYVTVSYHGENKIFKSCRPDYMTIAPGGNAQANPKGCLLKKISVSNRDKKAHPTIGGFERNFKLSQPGTAHGSWRVTPNGIEGPL